MKAINDEAKLEKFLELLPEEKVDEFAYQASDARFSGHWIYKFLRPYEVFSTSIESRFINVRIEEARKEFNKTFDAFNQFTIYNFFPYKSGVEIEDQRFGLYPEMRHAEGKDGRFWNEKYQELLSLIKAFEEQYRKFLEVAFEELSKSIKESPSRSHKPVKDGFLLGPELRPEIAVGDLVAYSDGTIRYKNEIVDLRNQLKDLCRLFMRNQNRVLILEDIKNEIIPAPKRKTTSNQTIAKYVSELRTSLKGCFQRDVLHNQKGEGWYLDLKK